MESSGPDRYGNILIPVLKEKPSPDRFAIQMYDHIQYNVHTQLFTYIPSYHPPHTLLHDAGEARPT